MNYNEFAEKVKAKYPDYADMDNRELAQKLVQKYPNDYGDVTFDIGAPEQPSMMGLVADAGKRAITAPLDAARNMTPENMSPYLPLAGMAAGTAFGGPIGAAAGAGLGQIGKRIADIGYGRVQPGDAMDPLKESIAPMAQVAFGAIPDVSGVVRAGTKTLTQSIGSGLAKTAETLTGVKRDIYAQAAKQGLRTYGAPSMKKAQEIYGQALGKEGQKALKLGADDVFDPALGRARSTAIEIGKKIEAGEPVTALDALKARQATDRIISSTPVTDRTARHALSEWRTKFDDVISSQSGPLKEASTKYRQAIVKSKLLSPTRLTKSGEPSAFLPLVLGAGARTAEGIVAGVTGTSPLAWGLGATIAGSVNPMVRRALITELISRVTTKSDDQAGR